MVMKIASSFDRTAAIRIITRTFHENPSVNAVIGEGGNRDKKIRRLAKYAFVKAMNRKGAYLSSNQKGVALCFESTQKGGNLIELLAELQFAASLPLNKIVQTLRREKYLKQHRLSAPHLYFWFLGVEKEGGSAVFEIKNSLFQLADERQLPIVLETSVPRNKLAYERYGFNVYHEWKTDGHTLWFMVREPKLL